MAMVHLPGARTEVVPVTDDRLSARNRAFLQRRRERAVPHRALVADGAPLNLADKIEARRLRVLRQGWQEDAMNYADALPELSFAYRFLQHCSSRMQYYPALVNPDDPGGPPIPAHEAIGKDNADAPQGLVDSMNAAMASLGMGRLGLAPIQTALSWNFGVPGEAYILGQEDGQGNQTWSVRSIDEFMVYEDTYKLREVPLDPQGTLGWIDLDPDHTYAARMWVPHPRFRKLATSPMRSLIDVAEELLLLSRDVRATARSRLAGAGILKVPEGLRMMSFEGEGDDPMTDRWFGRFAELMMTPIADEGVASAVVPIALTGDPEALAQLDHLVLDRPYSALAIELRAESIGRLATGLDVPREVLEGMSDPNHWGAWLVSDDTFRHHVEPQVIEQVDSLSVAYLRQWLIADGIPEYWVKRACLWYDPVELITKPDPMANAIQLHDRFAISNRALREAGGFAEEDAPDSLEIEFRMLQKTRTFPPNMVEAIFHAYDPSLTFPPISKSGEIPGISSTGEEFLPPDEPPPPPTGSTGAPPPPASPDTGPAGASAPAPSLPSAATERSAEALATPPATPEHQAESFAPKRTTDLAPYQRLSRKLAQIDAMTRARIQTAATAHMVRLLDRAGAKLRTKSQQKRYAGWAGWDRIKPADVTNARVAATLGEANVMALGYPDAHALLDADWSELRRQFTGWVKAAQTEAVKVACALARTSTDSPAARALADRLEESIEPAWTALQDELNARAAQLLWNPAPSAADTMLDPNTVVKAGTIRRALAIAGGGTPTKTVTAADDGAVWGSPDDPSPDYRQTDAPLQSPVEPGTVPGGSAELTVVPDGQIGTGDAVVSMLADVEGLGAQSFEWVHGPTMRPFEPHEELDGVSFSSWDDDVLAPPPEADWLGVSSMFPGDHDGCSCDFTTIWAPTGDTEPGDQGAGGRGTGLGELIGDLTGDTEAAAAAGAEEAGAAAEAAPEPSADEAARIRRNQLQQARRASRAAAEDEAGLARGDLDRIRDTLHPMFLQRQEQISADLERTETFKLRAPVKDETGRMPPEYDFMDRLSPQERQRLASRWFDASPDANAPDQFAELWSAAQGREPGTDAAMQWWLDQTRAYDAAGSLARGKIPDPRAIGNFDINTLVDRSATPYRPGMIFGDDALAAKHAAEVNAAEAEAVMDRELPFAKLGPNPWDMTEQAWTDEINRLADIVDNATPVDTWEGEPVYSAEVVAAESRLDELMPSFVDDLAQAHPEYSATDLHTAIVNQARISGLIGPG